MGFWPQTRTPSLPEPIARAALDFLGVPAGPPSAEQLDRLVTRYVERVPWESASRIARRAAADGALVEPRWPEVFWPAAIERGEGGTCFESNYAFFALLRALGFTGYLTINDLHTTRACHTAIVVSLDGTRRLADVGFPVHLPVPFDPRRGGRRAGPHHSYAVIPEGEGAYRVERDRHPRPYAFTLRDRPVSDAAYRAATAADYGPEGLFLDRVIITRVVDGAVARFATGEGPPTLERFPDGRKVELPLGPDPAATLARYFGMDRGVIARALQAVELATGR